MRPTLPMAIPSAGGLSLGNGTEAPSQMILSDGSGRSGSPSRCGGYEGFRVVRLIQTELDASGDRTAYGKRMEEKRNTLDLVDDEPNVDARASTPLARLRAIRQRSYLTAVSLATRSYHRKNKNHDTLHNTHRRITYRLTSCCRQLLGHEVGSKRDSRKTRGREKP